MPMTKPTRLLFTLALLAAAVPLLADRAGANEVALKCTFSLWKGLSGVSPGRAWGPTLGSGSTVVESSREIEERLARAPSKDVEVTRAIALNAPPTDVEVTSDSIVIGVSPKPMMLFPGRGYDSGFYELWRYEISRIDLSARARFLVFFPRDGRRTEHRFGGNNDTSPKNIFS